MTKHFDTVEWRLVGHFWRASKHYPRDVWLTMFIPISSIAMGSLVPLFIGKILAALANPAGDPLSYLPWLIGTGVLGVIGNRIGYSHLLRLQACVMSDLQTETLDTLLARSVGFHNNRVSGKLVSDANDYPHSYVDLSNAIFVNIIPFVVIVLTGLAIVGVSSWQMGLMLFGMAGFTIGSGIYSTLGRSPLRKRRHVAGRAVTAHLADTIVNTQTVKTFARERSELETHGDLNSKLRKMRVDDWQLAAHSNNLRIAILMAFQIGFIVTAVYITRNDPALLGVGIFAFSYTVTLSTRLIEINSVIRALEDVFLKGTPMYEIVAETPEILDDPNATALSVKQGALSLRDVHFKYREQSSSKEVFGSLTLDIPSGQRVGLVGPSGGGKTTLTRLLLRFDDINDGVIAIDGQNIAKVTQESLRQSISYVPQDPLLFHRTIRENVAYGRPGASFEDIENASSLAYADGFIDSLAGGYETVVGERGVKLSGGQRQRIAIARAILKDAPILVLDEATSALDSESESLIQKALWRLMQNRTAIVVAHRLSTIQKMDRILVLDDGKIVEDGSHDQLIKLNGLYARLWKRQSGGFIEE